MMDEGNDMKRFECKQSYDLNDFVDLISFLRSENGCPWDRVQTHESIRRNLLEEAYELAETIDLNDKNHMKEELGDVMMQVLFHSDIEAEAGVFDINDVADHACKKLVTRHPNLFGEKTDLDWDAIKRRERGEKSVAAEMSDVSHALPALWRADKIQRKASKIGYDWPDVHDALDKIEEEALELRQGVDANDEENIIEELGDLIFAVVDAARMLGIDPESAVHQACEKAIRRFTFMEQAAEKLGKSFADMSLSEMELLHQQARSEQEGKEPVYDKIEYFRSYEIK